jgi:hypothetical protein
MGEVLGHHEGSHLLERLRRRVGLYGTDLVGEDDLVEESLELQREQHGLDILLRGVRDEDQREAAALLLALEVQEAGQGHELVDALAEPLLIEAGEVPAVLGGEVREEVFTVFELLRPLMFSLKNRSSISMPWGRSTSTHVGRCRESVSASVPSRSKSRARYKVLSPVEEHVQGARDYE